MPKRSFRLRSFCQKNEPVHYNLFHYYTHSSKVASHSDDNWLLGFSTRPREENQLHNPSLGHHSLKCCLPIEYIFRCNNSYHKYKNWIPKPVAIPLSFCTGWWTIVKFTTCKLLLSCHSFHSSPILIFLVREDFFLFKTLISSVRVLLVSVKTVSVLSNL